MAVIFLSSPTEQKLLQKMSVQHLCRCWKATITVFLSFLCRSLLMLIYWCYTVQDKSFYKCYFKLIFNFSDRHLKKFLWNEKSFAMKWGFFFITSLHIDTFYLDDTRTCTGYSSQQSTHSTLLITWHDTHNNKLTEKCGGLENYRRLKTHYMQFFKVLDKLKTFWQEFGQKLASTWPTKWNRQGSICYSWRKIKCYIKNCPPARQDARVSVHIYHELIEWCPELTLENRNTAEVPCSPSLSGNCNQHLAHASVKSLAELTE